MRLICHDTQRPVICPSADFLDSFRDFPSRHRRPARLSQTACRGSPPCFPLRLPPCQPPHLCFSGIWSRFHGLLYLHIFHRTTRRVILLRNANIYLDALLPRASAVRDSTDTSGSPGLEQTQCNTRLLTHPLPKPHPRLMFEAENLSKLELHGKLNIRPQETWSTSLSQPLEHWEWHQDRQTRSKRTSVFSKRCPVSYLDAHSAWAQVAFPGEMAHRPPFISPHAEAISIKLFSALHPHY